MSPDSTDVMAVLRAARRAGLKLVVVPTSNLDVTTGTAEIVASQVLERFLEDIEDIKRLTAEREHRRCLRENVDARESREAGEERARREVVRMGMHATECGYHRFGRVGARSNPPRRFAFYQGEF